jgi:carbamoyl-phosphate synthase small subunit
LTPGAEGRYTLAAPTDATVGEASPEECPMIEPTDATATSAGDPFARPVTGALVLADGTVFTGTGFGAVGEAVGEICFNTSMTGYQEILTDPSYAGQVICFTFPHIGNVGANPEDVESQTPACRGLIVRGDVTEPSNWRAVRHLDDWLRSHGLIGLAGIDTRRLTRRIRDLGAPNGCILHAPSGRLNLDAARETAAAWPGLEGMDLAIEVTGRQTRDWTETTWTLGTGYGTLTAPRHHVVAVDYGAKHNIMRELATAGCRVTVVPATATAAEIMAHRPDGVFLSNGPGDPAATGEYAVPVIRDLLAAGTPLFGICLGHQLLALALGGRTAKMARGHRGANHPVLEKATGRVEITSQNHGFSVLPDSLPAGVETTHTSLFDGSNEGLRVTGKPVFSVQHHPEASPGPTDANHLFRRFVALMEGA